MTEAAPGKLRVPAVVRGTAGVVLAWIAASLFVRFVSRSAVNAWVDDAIVRVLSGFPSAQIVTGQVIQVFETSLVMSCWFALFLASLAMPLGYVARFLARARIRSGDADPLDRVRAWAAAHPRWTRVLLALLPVAWGVLEARYIARWNDATAAAIGGPILLAVACLYALARAGLRALLAPTMDASEETRVEITDDEIRFDAVAVTRETQAAVAGLAAITLGMVVWLAALPLITLYRDPRVFSAMAAYVALAAGGATFFRRASRVAVGIDGVHVYGTSRTRFFAYRDLDAVSERDGDLELVRRDRALVRLQLHGADARRRDAIALRIRASIGRVKEGKHSAAAHLVASATTAELTRVAQGGSSYRSATVSREQLWALVEGPAIDADARRAAAEALVKVSSEGERARLRVAAERCAEPRVRVALEALASAEDEAAPEAHTGAGAPDAPMAASRAGR